MRIDWTTLYLHANSWGIQPSEFWAMTMPEWFALHEFHRESRPGDYAGKLTKADVDELWEYALDGAA